MRTKLWAIVTIMATSGACQQSTSNVNAVVGLDEDGNEAAFAIVSVYNQISLPAATVPKEDASTSRFHEIVTMPLYALLECKKSGEATASAKVAVIEQFSREQVLVVTPERKLATIDADAKVRLVGCALLGDRLASPMTFYDSSMKMRAFPSKKPTSDGTLKALSTAYRTAQMLFLAMRGSSTQAGGAIDPVKATIYLKSMRAYTGVDPMSYKALIASWEAADRVFNPCNHAKLGAEFWYADEWKEKNVSCVPSSERGLFDYRPGSAGGATYASVRDGLAIELSAVHRDLFVNSANETSSDGRIFEALTSLRNQEGLESGAREIAGFILDGKPKTLNVKSFLARHPSRPDVEAASLTGEGFGLADKTGYYLEDLGKFYNVGGLMPWGRSSGRGDGPSDLGSNGFKSLPPVTNYGGPWKSNSTNSSFQQFVDSRDGEIVNVLSNEGLKAGIASGALPANGAAARLGYTDWAKEDIKTPAGENKTVYRDATIPKDAPYQQYQDGTNMIQAMKDANGKVNAVSTPMVAGDRFANVDRTKNGAAEQLYSTTMGTYYEKDKSTIDSYSKNLDTAVSTANTPEQRARAALLADNAVALSNFNATDATTVNKTILDTSRDGDVRTAAGLSNSSFWSSVPDQNAGFRKTADTAFTTAMADQKKADEDRSMNITTGLVMSYFNAQNGASSTTTAATNQTTPSSTVTPTTPTSPSATEVANNVQRPEWGSQPSTAVSPLFPPGTSATTVASGALPSFTNATPFNVTPSSQPTVPPQQFNSAGGEPDTTVQLPEGYSNNPEIPIMQ